jgi:hypothetical protein
MRMPRFLALVSVLLAVPMMLYEAVVQTVDWLLGFIPSLASEPRLAVDGPAIVFVTPGVAADPAMLNSLRHEAGMRRLN